MNEINIGDIIRLNAKPEWGPLLILCANGENLLVMSAVGYKRIRNSPENFGLVAESELPVGSPVIEFRNSEQNALQGIPERLHADIRRIWYRSVLGGKKKFVERGNRIGLESQKEISGMIKREGISENDARWKAVNKFGQRLYRESP